MKLSIIVPVYNVAAYLGKCVDSLLAQDLPHEAYEIILVDDGSTDESGRIADKYAERYSNVVVIHKPNEGVSVARNTAMAQARGLYVQFVDADDYIMPNCLGALVRKMETDNLDVLRFNYQFVDEAGNVVHPNKYSQPDDYTDSVCNGVTFLNERLGGGCFVWQYIFRKETADIPFTPSIVLGEDTYWTIQMLQNVQRITSISEIIYNYLVRQGSATLSRQPEKIKKRLADQMWITSQMQEMKRNMQDHSWLDGQIANTVVTILTSVALNFYGERGYYISELRKMGVFPIGNHHLTPAAQRKRMIINLSPNLFCTMVHLKNK